MEKFLRYQLQEYEIKVRRSSSLQFTPTDSVVIDDAKLSEVSGLSRTTSACSSNIRTQFTYLFGMNSCNICLGCCRIRVASCLIGMISIAISVVTICCLLSVSSSLSRDMQNVVSAPIASLVLFQIATAMLLIIGVLIDTHFLLVPFLLNSVLHICLAVGIAISVLFSSGDIKKLYGPHIIIICLVALVLYVWFTIVVTMTIILIRDKRRLGEYFGNATTYSYDHQDEFDTTRGAIDRISSSVI
ncbi:hypothetical protein RB195_000123 [Necator americanus]|uniref:Uncharacterized protein n=1 Tax=Necator americanus TaxID=51031 RepID=A0ABR1D823_NECAM